MKWWQFHWSGLGKQRQQRDESRSRVTEASMRDLTRAVSDNEQAAKAVKSAVSRQMEASRPLRAVLKDLIERVNSDEHFSRLRKDKP
jgi:hypothetical protein